jgi:histidine triad (HIT) family protein
MRISESLTNAVFAIAHSPPGRVLVGWAFAHLSFALPVRRIIETSEFIAFYHPRPSCQVHILIVPKRAITGLQSLDEQHASLLREVFHIAGNLVKELGLEGKGAQLVVNGGAYQRIPHLHFHLVYDPVSLDTSRS